MTATAVHVAAFACVLGVTFARRPLPGAPPWMLPPLPDRVFQYTHVGAVEGWSLVAEITAAPEHDEDGVGQMPMSNGEFTALLTADPADVAVLDAIEADLASELDWRIASALLWLGADLELEHTLASLADYPGDCALREEVLTHA